MQPGSSLCHTGLAGGGERAEGVEMVEDESQQDRSQPAETALSWS